MVTSGPILKQPKPTIERDWLRPGAFASAVDFDSYWSGDALAQMDRIATDDHAQFRYYRELGYFQQTPEPYADLGELVTGRKPGRQSLQRAHDGHEPGPRSRRHGRGARGAAPGAGAWPRNLATALSAGRAR